MIVCPWFCPFVFVLGSVLLCLTDSPPVLTEPHAEVETTGERQGLGNHACRQLIATSSNFPWYTDPDVKPATEVVPLISHVTGSHTFSRTTENKSNCA